MARAAATCSERWLLARGSASISALAWCRRHEKTIRILDFRIQAIEDFEGDESFDAVLLINTLEYMEDVGRALDKIRTALRDGGRLLLSTANPLWSPVFSLASRYGLRIPDCERLFLTNEDVVVEHRPRLRGSRRLCTRSRSDAFGR